MARSRRSADSNGGVLRPGELLIGDHTPLQETHAAVVDGHIKGRGLVPRDYATHPPEMFDPPSQIQLIPRSEWPDRLKDQIGNASRNSDIRLRGNNGQPIPSLDQDGVGYCWAHSTTQSIILNRALRNQPYVPLSAFAVAATIKKGRDEGGWCGLSAEFATDKGIPSQAIWPQGDRDYRKYDKPETWTDAAKHKIVEQWVDLTRDVYDRNLTFDMLGSALLANLTGPVDESWWSHSIAALDLVDGNGQRSYARGESGKKATTKEFELMWGINHPVTSGYSVRIWNSWTDTWSDRGMGVLTGSKAVPDSALIIRTTTVAA